MIELRLRFWVRARRRRLDHELAISEESYTTVPRALRACQLSKPRTRAKLARGLRRIVAEVDRDPVGVLGSAVPIQRIAVRASREALLGLADRLESPSVVNARGLARAMLLLKEATGPLYSHNPDVSLPSAIWNVADGLQPCPPHDWRCPVVPKLDPDHVAWTCAICGTVASSNEIGEQPRL
jgi:hypothetical protein